MTSTRNQDNDIYIEPKSRKERRDRAKLIGECVCLLGTVIGSITFVWQSCVVDGSTNDEDIAADNESMSTIAMVSSIPSTTMAAPPTTDATYVCIDSAKEDDYPHWEPDKKVTGRNEGWRGGEPDPSVGYGTSEYLVTAGMHTRLQKGDGTNSIPLHNGIWAGVPVFKESKYMSRLSMQQRKFNTISIGMERNYSLSPSSSLVRVVGLFSYPRSISGRHLAKSLSTLCTLILSKIRTFLDLLAEVWQLMRYG